MIPNEEKKEFEVLTVNRYEVEENAVFLDYKIQTLRSQIQNFSETNFHVRMSLVKNLKSIQQVMKDDKQIFEKLLDKLSKDHEQMQLQLLQYFKSKRPFVKEIPHYKELILKPLKALAKGLYLQIKQQSCTLISQLAHCLKTEQIDEIIQFADSLIKSDNEQNKIVAIQLFARLASDLPINKRQAIFQIQFLKIYSGSSVRVKKQIILELGKLASNMSPQFVDNKIVKGFYLKEVKDNSWGIRKACIQIITELLLKVKSTKQDLCNVLLLLLKDGNKFVRIASHKIVPEFIAKYGSKNLPKAIFDVYVGLIDLDINNQVSKQNEIIQRISFYFPGVLHTVGVQKWSQLSSLFNRLLHHRSEEVKKPLADGLHQISQIIGPQNSKQYLFSSLDYILRQQMDSIKLCAIRNLAKFVAQFQTQTKQNLIDVFLVLQKDPKKWRVRFLISNQLKYLSQIYDADTNFKYLFPISLKLCNDQVSQVRKAASQQMKYVINQLKTQQHLYKMAVQSIIGYAASQKHLQRQTFCTMLQNLYQKQNSAQFYGNYQQTLQKLCKDQIPTVRIALAISIVNIIKNNNKQQEKLKRFIDILCKNEEVAQYFQDINLLGMDKEIQQKVNQKQEKQNNEKEIVNQSPQ